MELDQRIVVHTSNSIELDQSVCLVPSLMQTSEVTGVVEAVADVGKFLGAGQLYDEGKHSGKIQDEDYEDIGGFSVQKTHASLYEAIWLKYGHIATNHVLTDFYESQVMVVNEVMNLIVRMNEHPLEKIYADVIATWEKKLQVPEKLGFNIVWLRERFEKIKKYFAEGIKLEESLKEKEQTIREVTDAEQKLVLAKHKLSALETKISPIIIGRENFEEKCAGGLLLLNCHSNLALVTAPVQEAAILVEVPIDYNSKTLCPKRIAKKRRLVSDLNM